MVPIVERVIVASRGPLPALIAGVALALSGASTYWDIASHIDGGRERFLTPPHIGIYSGVTLALAVIALAMLSDRLRAGASLLDALRHPFRDVPPGLAAAGTGMATALAAAPFDNAWHEVYGIDITIWSPPHLLAIFGVSVAVTVRLRDGVAVRSDGPLIPAKEHLSAYYVVECEDRGRGALDRRAHFGFPRHCRRSAPDSRLGHL